MLCVDRLVLALRISSALALQRCPSFSLQPSASACVLYVVVGLLEAEEARAVVRHVLRDEAASEGASVELLARPYVVHRHGLACEGTARVLSHGCRAPLPLPWAGRPLLTALLLRGERGSEPCGVKSAGTSRDQGASCSCSCSCWGAAFWTGRACPCPPPRSRRECPAPWRARWR